MEMDWTYILSGGYSMEMEWYVVLVYQSETQHLPDVFGPYDSVDSADDFIRKAQADWGKNLYYHITLMQEEV